MPRTRFPISRAGTFDHSTSIGSGRYAETTDSPFPCWRQRSPVAVSRQTLRSAAPAAGRTACVLLAGRLSIVTRLRAGCTKPTDISVNQRPRASGTEGTPWVRVLRRRGAKLAIRTLGGSLRCWDHLAAGSADRYLTNSSLIASAIKELYESTAEVLPPPPGLTADGDIVPVGKLEPGYFLCVSRLLPYKNVGAVVDAVRNLPRSRLVVVGQGPLLDVLRDQAAANVQFIEAVDDAHLRWLYNNSIALVSASYEDYGLTPIEAACFGRPSVVLGAGGFLDTVRDGVTGLYFPEPSREALTSALEAASEIAWDSSEICAHAKAFSKEAFIRRIHEVVREVMNPSP